ncbi:MAG: thiamine pyrophosphate-dependent enzyme, partial [bacterium]
DEVVLVSGIGCSSRMPVYLDFNTLHTTHGRAIAFATGIKLFKPHLKVIVITGDGDALAIGGNHIIHACRRNIGITTIIINNFIYGMTGGQVSPTTACGDYTYTSPYGNLEPQFDVFRLCDGAGATFFARTTTYHVIQLINFIKKALLHTGFSVVEVISQCPTLYGRLNNMPNPVDMIRLFKNNAIPVSKARELPTESLNNKIITGILKEENKPEYSELYWSLVKRVSEEVKSER